MHFQDIRTAYSLVQSSPPLLVSLVCLELTKDSSLTPQLIDEFIDRIVVHAPERKDGHRTQKVEIILKHIGKFRVPDQRLIRR